MLLITISGSEPVSGRLLLAACYLEDSVYTLTNKRPLDDYVRSP